MAEIKDLKAKHEELKKRAIELGIEPLTEGEFEDFMNKAEGICPECGEPHPDDDRVADGMKCRFCAYGDSPQ